VNRELHAVGGEVDEVSAALSIAGADLDPAIISRRMGIQPSFAARKGEQIVRGGRQVAQPIGVWLLSAPSSTEWLLDDIIRLLLLKVPPAGAIWDDLAEEFTLRLSCGLFLKTWQRGCSLTPDLLTEIGQRHLRLDLSVYAGLDEKLNEGDHRGF
jgi:hypothetical protein